MAKNDGYPIAPEGFSTQESTQSSRDEMLSAWAQCAEDCDENALPHESTAHAYEQDEPRAGQKTSKFAHLKLQQSESGQTDDMLSFWQDAPSDEDAAPAFGRSGWIIVAFAAAEALLCSFTLDPGSINSHNSLPGLGLTALMVLGFVAAYVCLGKRACLTPVSIAFSVVSLALSLTITLFGGTSLLLLNCIAAWFVGTYTLYLLSGQCVHRPLSISAVGAALFFFATGLFTNWSLPIKALTAGFRTRRDGTKRHATGVGLGIVIALCLLLIVIVPLLASADMVFESMVSRLLDALWNLQIGDVAWHVAYTLIAGPFMFGLLWGLVNGTGVSAPGEGAEHTDELSAGIATRCKHAALIVVLVALCLVYAFFAWIQFRYLFSGTEAVSMHGGYAEYARSGFFQLCAITFINSAVILLSAQVAHLQAKTPNGKHGVMRVMTCLLVALTAVILASACMRMLLYIGAYGLTILRLLTLFIMAFEAIILVALLAKAFVERTNFFATFFAGAIAVFLVFTFANPAAVIANYNVDSYIAGNTREVDLDYLTGSLSSDAIPALEKLDAYLSEHPERDLYLSDYANYDADGVQLQTPKMSEMIQRALRCSNKAQKARGDIPWTLWHRDLPGAGMYIDVYDQDLAD